MHIVPYIQICQNMVGAGAQKILLNEQMSQGAYDTVSGAYAGS